MALKALTAKPKPQHAHVAEAIRAYVTREGISLSDLGRRLGGATNLAHTWAVGAGGVSPTYRAPLAKLLGVPADFLAPRRYDGEALVTLGPARQALALATDAQSVVTDPQLTRGSVGKRMLDPAPALGGKLTYEGHGDGTATIAVRARLPLAQAKPLFRVLLDSGIDLVAAEHEEAGAGVVEGRET